MPEFPRDVRIDTIGFAAELDRQLIKELRADVKARMTENDTVEARGDAFRAVMAATTSTKIDAKALYRMVKAGAISEKDFVSAISVTVTPLKKFLAEKDIARISEQVTGTPQLSVKRIEEVEVDLVACLRGLNQAAEK